MRLPARRRPAKRSRKIAPIADRLVYADASALVKLVVQEAESGELREYLADRPALATSRIASVEVTRASLVASPDEGFERATRLLDGCVLIDVDRPLLERARRLVSERLRTLDALHLATALLVGPDALLAYDSRLLEAAESAGLAVSSPGFAR